MKRLIMVAALVLAFVLSIVLVACDNVITTTQQNKGYSLDFNTVYALAEENGYTGTLEELVEMFKGENAYQLAVAAGYTGTQQEWLLTLRGAAGADGITPTIGENKHWFLGDLDTGVVAEGKDGKDGNGIDRIEKTDSVDLVDTYTIHFTDGTSTTFEISNGTDGKDGLSITQAKFNDQHELEITLSDGTVLNAGRVDGSHEHKFGEWTVTVPATCAELGTEVRTCYCGEQESRVISLIPHTYGDWGVTLHATCTATGTEERACLVCQTKEQRILPLVAHNEVIDQGYAATCIDTGLTEGKHCSVCHTVLVAQRTIPIDSTAHDYGAWTISTVATCTENGLRYHICTRCNAVDRQTLVATGHQGEWQTVIEPKCLTEGLRTMTCTVCGQTVSEAIPSLGHTVSEWIIEKEPTCGVGVKRFRCERCAYSVCQAIPADLTKQHSFVNNLCNVCGEHMGTEGLQYQINGDSAHVVGYTGTDRDIYIPSMYAGAMVKDIGTTFFNNTSIISITIPIGVATIQENAFSHSGLTSIAIPDSVTSIGAYAFSDCSGLTSITIPDSVTAIGYRVFYGCSGLSEMTIPFVGSSRGASSADASTLFGYIFGSTPYTGAKPSFQSYSLSHKYEIFYIPDTLRSVTVTGGNILYGAFDDCFGLTSITIGSGVTYIGERAFYRCSGLTSFIIPSSLISIERQTFASCIGLTSVEIPNSVITIRDGAFYGCRALTSVAIPSSVVSIGDGAFGNCSGLSSIVVEEGNSTYHSQDNCLIETSTKTLILGCQNSVIPSNGCVTVIGGGAFYACIGLTAIAIPSSVTTICKGAFSSCIGLTAIITGSGVTTIGNHAFNNCSGLTSITIGSNVTSIGVCAFDGCSGLSSIIVEKGNSIYHSQDNCLIETSTKTMMLGCQNSVIPTNGSVTTIGDDAFSLCTNLTSIIIPSCVSSIRRYAFYLCSGLTTITIPDSVYSIGECAFEGCIGLTSIHYQGTKAQWSEISKGDGWNTEAGNYVVICTDGEIAKS